MIRFASLLAALCIFVSAIQAQQTRNQTYKAHPLAKGTQIIIDGLLTDSAWQHIPGITQFRQRQPIEGAPATTPVNVAIAYTKEHLIVGARILKDPEDIQSIVSRRDRAAKSERLILTIDTYNNERTSYSFGVTASGVRLDYFHPSDNAYDRDYSYDPVWQAATNVDSEGWTAEMSIPFSQLRFNADSSLTFGLNINHYIPNLNEDSFWVYIPSSETGWASRFGKLRGLQDIEEPTRIEFLPYVAGSDLYREQVNPDNPFIDHNEWDLRAGGDVKLGLGPGLTLDATINPDFGQVESDPAVVNLSAFEIFQSEKRPFFTEGSNLLEGGGSGYFYSRRIGAAPSYTPNVSSGYVKNPGNTTILGAGKVTGILENNLSIGVLSALTAPEYAQIYHSDTDRFNEVKSEPLTSYNVVRLQKQFGPYGSTGGFILTGVGRNHDRGGALDQQLNRSAFTGGTDWNLRFDEGTYELSFNAGFSHITGSENAILQLQRGSQRYFQRPDADYVSIDSSRTDFTGYSAGVNFEKRAGKHWTWEIGGSLESPEFELNDIGRISTADDVSYSSGIRYSENQPGSWYQKYNISGWLNSKWNFGGIRNNSSLGIRSDITFLDFSSFRMTIWDNIAGLSDNLTRGGPLMRDNGATGINVNYGSNTQLSNYWRLGGDIYNDDYGSKGGSVWFELGGLLGSRWEYSVRPNWKHQQNAIQFVDTYTRSTLSNSPNKTYGKRYIFSDIDFTTISATFRFNVAFTPDLSLDIYAEPFVSSGNYHNFGELSEAGTGSIERYSSFSAGQDGSVNITDDGTSFTIRNRDFQYFSFRSNLVLRYQWAPGSTLFVVWQQNRSASTDYYNLARPQNLLDTFGKTGNQFLAFKISYWLPV